MEESEGKTTREDWSVRWNIVGFEDGGRGPQAKECGWSLEAGADTLIFSPVRPMSDLYPTEL